jgi:hypothetical protein
MNSVVQGFFVCGFGDSEAGVAGLAWDLSEPAALLLSEGEARSATFALEEGGDAATLEITAGDVSLEATLSPRTAEIPLGDEGGLTVAVCIADVNPRDGSQSFRCPGQISRWSADPLEGAGTARHLALDAGEESLLVVESAGEPGAGHADERVGAWLIRGEDDTPFEDTFVSTQYDGQGAPTRFGLELWPEEAERASRAAATRVTATSLGGISVGSAWAGLFRCHTDGFEGLGSYLLWRT